jgi:hypothetical protein
MPRPRVLQFELLVRACAASRFAFTILSLNRSRYSVFLVDLVVSFSFTKRSDVRGRLRLCARATFSVAARFFANGTKIVTC